MNNSTEFNPTAAFKEQGVTFFFNNFLVTVLAALLIGAFFFSLAEERRQKKDKNALNYADAVAKALLVSDSYHHGAVAGDQGIAQAPGDNAAELEWQIDTIFSVARSKLV
jgi:hypothetical protein